MADLEDLGFIASPHTSAGRIPTPRGYRFFVDTLLTIKPLDSLEINQFEGQLHADNRQRLVASASQALADVNPQAVYHLAGSAHVAQSWRDIHGAFEGNVLATHHLFEGLRTLTDKPRVLVACTGHVYAPQPRPIREDDEVKPASPYATSKLAAEMLAGMPEN